MNRRWYLFTAALLAVTLTLACGGDDGDDEPESRATPGATTTGTTATTGAGDRTPVATASGSAEPSGDIRTFTMADAQALLDAALLTPADLQSKWTIGTDTTQDNAAAATAAAATDPNAAASFERCGRLLSRLVVNMPEDTVTRYIGGETVSFFSTATVYATSAGATDCATEAAARLSNCTELARAFGTVFLDPTAVSCVPVDRPQIADGSFSTNLIGKIEAAGTIVDLTIQIVAFRRGNVTVVVGSAAAFDPSKEELTPLVDLVLERVKDAQS